MNDLGLISTQLWELCRSGAVPGQMSAGGALRCLLDERRGVQLRFRPQPPRWQLGVDLATDTLDDDQRAWCHEALLRIAHASRWTAQQVGGLDDAGCARLVDCDFPGTLEQAAALPGAEPIEGSLGALLQQLEALCAGADAPGAAAPAAGTPTPAPGSESNHWLRA